MIKVSPHVDYFIFTLYAVLNLKIFSYWNLVLSDCYFLVTRLNEIKSLNLNLNLNFPQMHKHARSSTNRSLSDAVKNRDDSRTTDNTRCITGVSRKVPWILFISWNQCVLSVSSRALSNNRIGEHARALWLTSNNSDISLCLLVSNVYDRWSWLERTQSYAWSLKLAIPVWLWDMRAGDSTDCDFRTNDDSPASNAERSIDSCRGDTSANFHFNVSSSFTCSSSFNAALQVRKCSPRWSMIEAVRWEEEKSWHVGWGWVRNFSYN